jgi:hypothetical protein
MLANPDIGVTQIAHRLGVSLPVHPRRANRGYLRWLSTPALTPEAGRRRRRVRGVSLSGRNGVDGGPSYCSAVGNSGWTADGRLSAPS